MNDSGKEIVRLIYDLLEKEKKLLIATPYLELGSDPEFLKGLIKNLTDKTTQFTKRLELEFTLGKDVAAANQFFRANAGLKKLIKLLEDIKQSHYGTVQNTLDVIAIMEDCLLDLDRLLLPNSNLEPNNQASSSLTPSPFPVITKQTQTDLPPPLESAEPMPKPQEPFLPPISSKSEASTPSREMSKHPEPTELLDILKQYFDRAEFRELCLHLNIDYEALGGEEGAKDKPVRLIEYCIRRNRLEELEQKVRELRPLIFKDEE